jgi:hypothetical protein
MFCPSLEEEDYYYYRGRVVMQSNPFALVDDLFSQSSLEADDTPIYNHMWSEEFALYSTFPQLQTPVASNIVVPENNSQVENLTFDLTVTGEFYDEKTSDLGLHRVIGAGRNNAKARQAEKFLKRQMKFMRPFLNDALFNECLKEVRQLYKTSMPATKNKHREIFKIIQQAYPNVEPKMESLFMMGGLNGLTPSVVRHYLAVLLYVQVVDDAQIQSSVLEAACIIAMIGDADANLEKFI